MHMSLRASLTIWSVILMAVVVSLIGAVDLSNEMQQQFDFTMERAELLRRVATNMVLQTLDRQRTVPLREALRDPNLATQLVEIMTSSRTLLEIAVCDRNSEILADSDPARLGKIFAGHADFEPVVTQPWWGKLEILLGDKRYYQLEQPLGTGGQTLLYVRVVVYPALIRTAIMPRLRKNAAVALVSILSAIVVTLIFSTIAFRPLGRLGKMLDMLAQGEYDGPETQPPPSPRSPVDELGLMATKVSLLGQQLRGARYDVSDLRGNLERLLDELEDAVFIFGRERRLVVASGAVEKFLSKQRSDLLGQSLPDIFPPNTTLGLLLAQAAQTGRALHNRRVPIERDSGGSAIVLLSVEILEGLNADPSTGRTTGVLVRLRDPEATQQISRRLQMAERLSAISRITSGVAHEVKNPLNAILMHVELARMKLGRGEYDLEGHMETISKEILRLDRVVKTFLDFTRPLELKLTEVPVDTFVDDLVQLARPQAASRGINMTVRQESQGVEIRVDRDLMKQAVLNVVVNAIEAMPQGGELVLESTVQDEQAEIRVSDNGPGIPPELREKIFRLYFTTKKEGSGIGLAMAFRVVQMHDGTIDFSSEPGKGTTFVLRLPTAS